MAKHLTPEDVDHLISRSVSALPGDMTDPLRLLQETATEWLIDDLAQALVNRQFPDLADIEQRIIEGLDDRDVPPWLIMSRVVLVVRDAMQTPAFARAIDRLPAKYRLQFFDDWAAFAARLYQEYPDDQIAGRPAVAVTLLAGQSKPLRKALSNALSMELRGRQPNRWWDGLSKIAARSTPNQPRRQNVTTVTPLPPVKINHAAAEEIIEDRPVFDADRGIKRPSGTPRLTAQKRAAEAPQANPVTPQPRLTYGKPAAKAPPMPTANQPRADMATAKPSPHAGTPNRTPDRTPDRTPARAPDRMPSRTQAVAKPAAPQAAPQATTERPESTTRPVRSQQNRPQQNRGQQNRAPNNRALQRAGKTAPSRGFKAFEASIEQRFESRGLAPIAVTAAAMAALVMAERVQNGDAPDFYEVEYEVLARSGEAVAPGAVRTWTLHAFMECMRDEWFRELFHALPSQARAETVWVWAKAAAEWFDVPVKLREFWVRALSGGDPVLAAAAARAFAAKTPQLPTRPVSHGLQNPISAPMPTAFSTARAPVEQPVASTPPMAQSDRYAGYQAHSTHQPLPAAGEQLIADEATVMEATVVTVPVQQTPALAQPSDYRHMPVTKALGPMPQATRPTTSTAPKGQPMPSAGLMMGRRPQSISLSVSQARQHQHMPPKPAHPTGIFERQTPRPMSPAVAQQSTARSMNQSAGMVASQATGARPLPKRLGMPPMPPRVAQQPGPLGKTTPLGAPDIQYGLDRPAGSPADLSVMEPVGSGD